MNAGVGRDAPAEASPDPAISAFAAMINGWRWQTAPTVIILTVFLGLFFLTVGLDQIANPRRRRS